jgi:hypothetical protein
MRAFLLAVCAVGGLWPGCGPSGTTPPGTCDATNCSGCCDGDRCISAAEQDDQYCGASGATCGGCGPRAHCGASGCMPVDACAMQNGGCDANATCMQYGVDDAFAGGVARAFADARRHGLREVGGALG